MNIIDRLLELIYPSFCPGCGKKTDPQDIWCEKCFLEIWDPRMIGSSHTKYLNGCYALCDYKTIIRECMIQLKFNDRTSRKRVFPMLLERFPWWDRLDKLDEAIPVPLSPKRKKERGFNQVDVIFEKWMVGHGWIYDKENVLRLRSGRVQSLLTKEERIINIQNQFIVRKGMSFKGKRVLILDDIYTTGSTMNEVAKELKKAGAKEVVGLVIASGAI